jgi:alcohol dehydrogenase class IV
LSTLLVCSNSTKDLLKGYDRKRIVTSAPDKSILDEVGSEESVVAIGGGAVVDTAKILCKNPIDCYPTTAAGSSATSWSVYWDGSNKCSLKRHKPDVVTFHSGYVKTLPDDMILETKCDVVSHCLDSLHSTKATKESINHCNNAFNWLQKYKNDNLYLVKAGHEAGNAIEIAGTNLLHSLSYPITGHYGVSHGRALGYLLPKVSKLMDNEIVERAIDILGDINIELDIDIDFVIGEALKYDKIYEVDIFIDRKTLQEVLL